MVKFHFFIESAYTIGLEPQLILNKLPKNDRSLGLCSKTHQLSQNGPVCELHSNWWLVVIKPAHKNLSYFISIVNGQNMTPNRTFFKTLSFYKNDLLLNSLTIHSSS